MDGGSNSMKINIVTVQSGWILTKIAERLAAHIPGRHEVVMSPAPIPGFDAYYYNDIQNCYFNYKIQMPQAAHVGYLTHAHENNAAWLHEMFDQQGGWDLDRVVSMNMRYTDMLDSIGYSYNKILTTTPPANAKDFLPRKTKLLIANRGGFEGYGHDFMMALPDGVETYMAENFEFIFLGNGWDPVFKKYSDCGIDGIMHPDSHAIYPQDYETWYQKADFLLVPILWTAGPYCAMEAHLAGLPIIASDVGLINYEVIPDYCYEPGNKDELMKILHSLRKPIETRRNRILALNNWDRYANHITAFIEGAIDGRQG
jgi:hypothetical protein